MSGPREDTLRLRILLPTEILVDLPARKVIAEGEDGLFCLLPRHVDFVAALVPGIVTYADADGAERYAAVDRGVLVKCGREVHVSTFDGVCGTELFGLSQLVEARFLALDEQARHARSALARLEAGALRGFRGIQETGRG